jgi:hypothetical protein
MERSYLKTRLARVSDQGREDDLRMSSAAQRLAMVWPLTLDAWLFKGESVAEPRVQKHIIHVQRREG